MKVVILAGGHGTRIADLTNLNVNINCLFLPQGLSLFKDIYSVNPGSYIELNFSNKLYFKEI